jgi:hypothetical protein
MPSSTAKSSSTCRRLDFGTPISIQSPEALQQTNTLSTTSKEQERMDIVAAKSEAASNQALIEFGIERRKVANAATNALNTIITPLPFLKDLEKDFDEIRVEFPTLPPDATTTTTTKDMQNYNIWSEEQDTRQKDGELEDDIKELDGHFTHQAISFHKYYITSNMSHKLSTEERAIMNANIERGHSRHYTLNVLRKHRLQRRLIMRKDPMPLEYIEYRAEANAMIREIQPMDMSQIYTIANIAVDNAMSKYAATFHPIEGYDLSTDFPPCKFRPNLLNNTVQYLKIKRQEGRKSPHQADSIATESLNQMMTQEHLSIEKCLREKRQYDDQKEASRKRQIQDDNDLVIKQNKMSDVAENAFITPPRQTSLLKKFRIPKKPSKLAQFLSKIAPDPFSLPPTATVEAAAGEIQQSTIDLDMLQKEDLFNAIIEEEQPIPSTSTAEVIVMTTTSQQQQPSLPTIVSKRKMSKRFSQPAYSGYKPVPKFIDKKPSTVIDLTQHRCRNLKSDISYRVADTAFVECRKVSNNIMNRGREGAYHFNAIVLWSGQSAPFILGAGALWPLCTALHRLGGDFEFKPPTTATMATEWQEDTNI